MTDTLHAALARELVGTPLEAVFSLRVDEEPGIHTFLEPGSPAARGLARALATNAEAARYLAHRPALLDEIANAPPDDLQRRAERLPRTLEEKDLETALDRLRLFRRDETLRTACLDLSGAIPFEVASDYLSRVAESCMSQAFDLASRETGRDAAADLAALGMGKVAGRELSYASDLDLIFLFDDGRTDLNAASRLAARLINYLATTTGAGTAYEIDSRLRPSGRQGTLVSTFAAFEQYQRERARLWERLAIVRARLIGGHPEGAAVCRRVQAGALRGPAWQEVADMRRRVEQERGKEKAGQVAYKTGRGGLMDIDFLASGGMLERRELLPEQVLPSVPAMLEACASGPLLQQLLEDYAFLRRVEARARWGVGRAVERIPVAGDSAPLIAELVESGLSPDGLASRLESARTRIRAAFDAVIGANSIAALSD